MAVNMNPLSITTSNWTAGGDGKLRGFDPSGSLGGGLEYDLGNHPTTVLWVEDGYVGTELGTESQPYSTLRTALDNTTNGQGATIIVKDGTINVTSANRTDWMINDRTGDGFSAINSGASWATSHVNRDNMITIKAQTPYGVRMSYTGAGGYYRSFVQLENAQYISVDGFIFEYDATAGAALLNGVSAYDNNYISRCIVKTHASGQAGAWFDCGDGSLIEMCAGVGATRYGFRSGSATLATQDHCFRLCVGRFDTGEFTVPSATFAHYGNNTGNTSRDFAFLNCIALDGQYDAAAPNDKYGGLYLPKNATDGIIKGLVVLNEDVQFAGVFAGEQQAQNVDISDSVMWDIGGDVGADGYRNNTADTTGHTADALTVGVVPDAFYYSGNSITATNSRASDTLNGTDKSILYQSDGADARYVYGSLGQRYGDVGFDTKSATPAFPWPYQSNIKTVFTEQVDTATDHYPAGNVSNRGFCLSTSLTDYIIKYVDGTTTLAEVYP